AMTIARKKAAHAKRDADKSGLNPHDALVLLTADHNEIDKLAREFERHRKTAGHVEKGKLAVRICHALTMHGRIKAEVFYPAAEKAQRATAPIGRRLIRQARKVMGGRRQDPR